ncbi:hypothetical protein [Dendronalium sp. ChiSLP03b]|uniref:hypothetical protein n=1 Tax=Dendronalium sp. ChiSLP03b TaxID=3075381 RepID=UPI002AD3977A|nr:hypothetical protein [Dendronalium sp. ChiSLP03b]MDZ8209473.1 hypothetical protein [Dendronalium sp. ChiSLP03b]
MNITQPNYIAIRLAQASPASPAPRHLLYAGKPVHRSGSPACQILGDIKSG